MAETFDEDDEPAMAYSSFGPVWNVHTTEAGTIVLEDKDSGTFFLLTYSEALGLVSQLVGAVTEAVEIEVGDDE